MLSLQGGGWKRKEGPVSPAEFACLCHTLNFPMTKPATQYVCFLPSSLLPLLSFCLLTASRYFPLPVLPCLLNSYSCFSPCKFLQILSRPLCLPLSHHSCGRVFSRLSCPFDFTRGPVGTCSAAASTTQQSKGISDLEVKALNCGVLIAMRKGALLTRMGTPRMSELASYSPVLQRDKST